MLSAKIMCGISNIAERMKENGNTKDKAGSKIGNSNKDNTKQTYQWSSDNYNSEKHAEHEKKEEIILD